MNSLNIDILGEISKYLNINDLINCLSVCKIFVDLFKYDVIWNPICNQINNNIMHYVKKDEITNGFPLYVMYIMKIKKINTIIKQFKLNKSTNELFMQKRLYLHNKQ